MAEAAEGPNLKGKEQSERLDERGAPARHVESTTPDRGGGGHVRHGASGDGGTESKACEEGQAITASTCKRALTDDLMERVCEKENLRRAYKRVRANKGAPGIDGMTVAELYEEPGTHRRTDGHTAGRELRAQPVKRGGDTEAGRRTRQLGIPTVVDRMVQQAILQVLEPLLDPTFLKRATDFAGGGAHAALRQAAEYR